VISANYIGGAFGNKADLIVEPIAAILSMKTGKPVRLAFTREEMFVSGGTRIPMIVDIRDGVKNDGTLLAREIRAILNVGAYAGSGAIITRNCCFGAVGTYKVENFKMDSYGVYLNETIVTPFRGFGTSQVLWAIESHMNIIAEKLGVDPVEVRRKNLLRENDTNANGEIVHSIGAKDCLEKVATAIGWQQKETEPKGYWRFGKGFALGNKYSVAPTDAVAIVKVWEDGTIEVRHSADEMGQGVNTVLAQIAAEAFKVDMEQTKVVWGDTSSTPHFPHGSTSQRTTYELGKAVYLACQDAKRQLFEIAAEKLDVSPQVLTTEKGVVYSKSNPSVSIAIPGLFTDGYVEKGGEILGKDIWIQHYAPEDPETGQIDPELARKGLRQAAFYGHSAQGVEAAVHTKTGEVKILKAYAATDMGFPINPKMCEQQMEGGLGMGIGSALWEEMRMDNGRVLNPNFMEYKIPAARDLPKTENFKTFMTPAPHKDGPYGAKGTGETQMTPSAPAVANAIYDAVGVRIKELPITREKILRALKEKDRR
jgi:CO/xanthine dehydrogenase Mo-binding subunit